jgi:hypothetical protein
MRENQREIFRRNANPIILHNYVHARRAHGCNRDRDPLVDALNVVERVFGVAEKIDQNLQDAVTVHSYGW